MANPEQIADLVELIREWYGPSKFNPSERVTAMWCKQLADLPAAALLLAFEQHTAAADTSREWPPQPGRLREIVASVTRPAFPTWGDAWAEVIRAIEQCGSYSEPTTESWSHPLIPQTIRAMGGWRLMCQMEVGNTHVDRAQWRQMYESNASRATRTADLLPDVRALAVKNGALPAPTEPAPKALPAPTQPRAAAPRPILAVLPAAIQVKGQAAPKNADDEYRERVRRAKADPSGPEAQAFAAQAEQMRRAALVLAARHPASEVDHAV